MKYSEINVLSLLLKEERAAECLHDVLGRLFQMLGPKCEKARNESITCIFTMCCHTCQSVAIKLLRIVFLRKGNPAKYP